MTMATGTSKKYNGDLIFCDCTEQYTDCKRYSSANPPEAVPGRCGQLEIAKLRAELSADLITSNNQSVFKDDNFIHIMKALEQPDPLNKLEKMDKEAKKKPALFNALSCLENPEHKSLP